MESKRQHQYSRQIQKDLGEIFQRDTRYFFLDNLVSIVGVETATDLSIVKIYFSIFPVHQGKKVLENLIGIRALYLVYKGKQDHTVYTGSKDQLLPTFLIQLGRLPRL